MNNTTATTTTEQAEWVRERNVLAAAYRKTNNGTGANHTGPNGTPQKEN